MELPEPRDLCLLLVRVDYADDDAWTSAVTAATAVYEMDDFDRLGACLELVESTELSGLSSGDLVQLLRAGYLGEFAVADAQTMQDHTLLFVGSDEHHGQVGRTFRSIPQQAEAIVANLSLSNMWFHEFADEVAPDGVFRGFSMTDRGSST